MENLSVITGQNLRIPFLDFYNKRISPSGLNLTSSLQEKVQNCYCKPGINFMSRETERDGGPSVGGQKNINWWLKYIHHIIIMNSNHFTTSFISHLYSSEVEGHAAIINDFLNKLDVPEIDGPDKSSPEELISRQERCYKAKAELQSTRSPCFHCRPRLFFFFTLIWSLSRSSCRGNKDPLKLGSC